MQRKDLSLHSTVEVQAYQESLFLLVLSKAPDVRNEDTDSATQMSAPVYPRNGLIEELHSKGYFVWFNSITLSCLERHILCAGYDDERSLKEGFEKGWGVLVRKHTDIIQTDWPALLSKYRRMSRSFFRFLCQ